MVDRADEPLEIELNRSRELRIRWADGRQSVYPLAMLRKACPCAECRQERERRAGGSLPILQKPGVELDMVTARKAELVGRYALSITWCDGHKAGIYDFALLRSLDAGQIEEKQVPERSAGEPGECANRMKE